MSKGRTWYPLGAVVPSRAAVAAAKKKGPIDPLTGPSLALAGRVVTMNASFTVKSDAVVYIGQGRIVAVMSRNQPAPPGFEDTPVLETGGTLFPGLIELHNHLSYNALRLWAVPRRFEHRGQWPNHKDYRPLISGPMTVLGKYKDAQGQFPFLPALIRYVECKCLLGGVTTSQGVKLASNAGIQRFYRGIVRNVEQTDDPELPEAQGRIPDIVAKDAKSFLARLAKEDSCFLLHLSEGVTNPDQPMSAARKHFLALEVAENLWALNDRFTGIHAAGLLPADFDVLARHKGSMVWSPLSNLLLYGATARVEAARESGVTIGLGSDWSPSGSKNLLGEMKVARLYSQHLLDGEFSARDIVAMATRDAAKILKWDAAIGSIESGKRADLIVVQGTSGDAYDRLLKAAESDLHLVMINGIARYGVTKLMSKLVPPHQTIRVGGQTRRLFLKQETADPDVAQVSLSHARSALKSALRDIAKLAKATEKATARVPARRLLDVSPEPEWSLALDEICDCGTDLAPRLPFNGPRDFTGPARAARVAAAAAPLSTLLKPLEIDPLTVADDDDFLDSIEQQPNLPPPIKNGLRGLY